MIASIVFLVEQVATGLYIIIAVALVLAVRSWARAGSAYRGTVFELERDIARYRRGNAFTVMVLLIEFGLVVVGVQRIVAPTLRETMTDLPQRSLISVASDGEFRTPIPPTFSAAVIDPSNVQLGDVDPAAQIQPTPTLTPTPVGTIVPNSPAAQCDSPDAQLQIPANGMIVFEPIPVVGVATSENFAFYRFELRGVSTSGNFATLGVDGTLPMTAQGNLGQFVPSFYTPGEYQFRLSVFDTTSSLRSSCTVTIYISAPIPTATPLGTVAP